MRCIDADRLLTDKMKSKYYHLPNGDIAIPLIDIEHAPTIEPERKTGHWKFDWKNNKATCSECGHRFKDAFDIDDFDNFCRHCGTKMEVKNE